METQISQNLEGIDKMNDLDNFQQDYEKLKFECDNLRGVLANKPSAWKEREKKYQFDEKKWDEDRIKLRKKIKMLQFEIQELRDQQKVNQLEKINKDQNQKILDLNTEVDNQKQKNHTLDLQITSLNLERQQLQDEVKQLLKKIESRQSKIMDIQDSIHRGEIEKSESLRTANKLESIPSVDPFQDKNAQDVLSSNQSGQSEYFRSDIEQLQKERKNLQQHISKIEEHRNKLNREKQKQEQKIIELECKVEQLQKQINGSIIIDTLEERPVQQEKIKIDNEELIIQNQSLLEMINQLKQQVSSLSGQIEHHIPIHGSRSQSQQLLQEQVSGANQVLSGLQLEEQNEYGSIQALVTKSSTNINKDRELLQENNILREQNQMLQNQIIKIAQENGYAEEPQEIGIDQRNYKLWTQNKEYSAQVQDMQAVIEQLQAQVSDQQNKATQNNHTNNESQGLFLELEKENRQSRNGFINGHTKGDQKSNQQNDKINTQVFQDILYEVRKYLSPQEFVDLLESKSEQKSDKLVQALRKVFDANKGYEYRNGEDTHISRQLKNGQNTNGLSSNGMQKLISSGESQASPNNKQVPQNDHSKSSLVPVNTTNEEEYLQKISNLEAKVDQYKYGQEQLIHAMQMLDQEKKGLEDQLDKYLKRLDQTVEDYVNQEQNEQNKKSWFKQNPQIVVLKTRMQELEGQLKRSFQEREMLKLKLYSMAMPSPRKNNATQAEVQQIDEIEDSDPVQHSSEAINSNDIKLVLQSAQNIDEELINQITQKTLDLEKDLLRFQSINKQLEQQNIFYRTQLVNAKVQIGDIQMESFKLKRTLIDYKQEHQSMQKEMDILKQVVSTRFPIQGQNAEIVSKQISKLYQNMDRMSDLHSSSDKLEQAIQAGIASNKIEVEQQQVQQNNIQNTLQKQYDQSPKDFTQSKQRNKNTNNQ